MLATTRVIAVLLVTATSAWADDPPFTIGSRPAWFLLGGVTAGDTLVSSRGPAGRGGSGFVGGELSLVRLRDGNYFGFYGDGYYDFGLDGTYVTGGLELGHRFVGIDGGGAVRFENGKRELGATVRLFATAGILTVFVRFASFDADRADSVVQVGGMLKFPLASPFGG